VTSVPSKVPSKKLNTANGNQATPHRTSILMTVLLSLLSIRLVSFIFSSSL